MNSSNRLQAIVIGLFGIVVASYVVVGEEAGELKKIFLPKSPKAAAYILRLKKNDELVGLERVEPVCVAILERDGIARSFREEALAGLAKLRQTDAFVELVAAIGRVDHAAHEAAGRESDDGRGSADAEQAANRVLRDLAELLMARPAEQLVAARESLTELHAKATTPLGRQVALAAIVSGDGTIGVLAASLPDGSPHSPTGLADSAVDSQVDLLRSISMVASPAARASYFPMLQQGWSMSDGAIRDAAVFAGSFAPDQQSVVLARYAELLSGDQSVGEIVAALPRIAPDSWTTETSTRVAQALVGIVQRTAAGERTQSPAREAMQLALEMAERLSTADAAPIRNALSELSVRQVLVTAPYEQMSYNPNVLIVAAGRSTEITFRNADSMPHNMLIGKPGSYDDVGLAAQDMTTQPNAQAKDYIPDHESVLHATKMVWPAQETRLAFVAPEELGVYPIICTFPGHWTKMFGAMIVVENVDAYLAANPTLADAGELLGRKVVKEWTFADLEQEVAAIDAAPRSFENGKRYFAKTSCVSCHMIGGAGNAKIGPDLTKVAEKQKRPSDVLQQIVEPSKQIDDQFASVILLANGRPYRGVVVKRTEDEIWLKENPLVDCEPTIVKIEDLDPEDGEQKSKLSPMPEGLLNTMYPEQILDLVAYVFSGGNPDHPLFTLTTADAQ